MPQLNFSVPASLLEKIDEAKPDFLSRAAFLSLLIDQSLSRGLTGGSTLPAYCVGAGTKGLEPDRSVQCLTSQQVETPAAITGACLQDQENLEPKKNRLLRAKKASDPFVKRVVTEDLVPAELADCSGLLLEFWTVKKGTRSQAVWNRICNKLRAWSTDQRREALERAIAAGWGDVFDPPAPRAPGLSKASEPSRHPAAREFRNGRFVDEEPVSNPVLAGLL